MHVCCTHTSIYIKHNIAKGPEGICTKLLLMKRFGEGGILQLFTSYKSFILYSFVHSLFFSILCQINEKTKQSPKAKDINKRKRDLEDNKYKRLDMQMTNVPEKEKDEKKQ